MPIIKQAMEQELPFKSHMIFIYTMELKSQIRENMVPVLFSFQKRRKKLNGVKKSCFRLLLKKVLILLSSDKYLLITRNWVKLQFLPNLQFSRFLFQPDWNRMNLKGNYTSLEKRLKGKSGIPICPVKKFFIS